MPLYKSIYLLTYLLYLLWLLSGGLLFSSSSAAWRSVRTQSTTWSVRTVSSWRSFFCWPQSLSSSPSTRHCLASRTSPLWQVLHCISYLTTLASPPLCSFIFNSHVNNLHNRRKVNVDTLDTSVKVPQARFSKLPKNFISFPKSCISFFYKF